MVKHGLDNLIEQAFNASTFLLNPNLHCHHHKADLLYPSLWRKLSQLWTIDSQKIDNIMNSC